MTAMRLTSIADLKRILRRYGLVQDTQVREAHPTNGMAPIVADVNRLRLDVPAQPDRRQRVLEQEAAE